MKVLQNLAALTAVIFIGACSTAPSAEEAFLEAVKGKVLLRANGDTLVRFSSLATKTLDYFPASGDLPELFTLKSSNNERSGSYTNSDGAVIGITLNDSKQKASFGFNSSSTFPDEIFDDLDLK